MARGQRPVLTAVDGAATLDRDLDLQVELLVGFRRLPASRSRSMWWAESQEVGGARRADPSFFA